MSKFHYVYEITNKLNGKIYVGKHSTTNLNDGYMGSGSILKDAIATYGLDNFEMTTQIMCESEEAAYQLESDIVDIEFIKRADTYNIVTGGSGQRTGYTHSPERLEKIRASSLGRKLPEEAIEKIREKATGRTHSEETKNLLSEMNTGKRASAETKLKMSESQRLRDAPTDETRAKLASSKLGTNNPNYGKTMPDEVKAKIRNKTAGVPKRDETKARMSEARTGYRYEELVCPHCGKTGRGPNMSRYHFNNCKVLRDVG